MNFCIGFPRSRIPYLLKMKLTLALVIVTFFQIQAESFAQKVTLSANKASLAETLRHIRQQTGIDYVIKNEQLEISLPVSLMVQNETLEKVLTKLFAEQPLDYVLNNNTIIVQNKSQSLSPTPVPGKAQQHKVIGTVKDENGSAIPGVMVIVTDGPSTTTDDRGNFALTVPSPEAQLTFRYIGYKSVSLSATAGQVLTVAMEQVIADLEQVVVTGYSTERRENITGSIASITGEKLESRPLTNLASGLQGLAPGLVMTRSSGQPGNEQWSANIRGVSSVNGNPPMVLVDGVRGSLDLVNPNDVESVTILKDASSTAIYGAAGAGGVILVTTKKGKGKLRIQYDGIFSTKKLGLFPELMSSYESAAMQNIAQINAGGNPSTTQEVLDLLQDPNINYRPDPSNPNNWQFLGNYDYIDLLTNSYAPRMNHNLSFSGSTEKESYLLSLGGFKEKGLFKVGPDQADRINARFNYNRTLSKNFSFDARMLYTQKNRDRSIITTEGADYSVIYELVSRRRTVPLYDPERPGQYNEQFPLMGMLESGGGIYRRDDEFSGVFTLQGNDLFVKNLNLRAVYSPRMINMHEDLERRSVPLYDLSGIRTYVGGSGNSQASMSKSRQRSLWNNVQLVGDYSINIEDVHQISVLAGYRFDDYRFDAITAGVRELPTNELFSLNYGNPELRETSDNIQTSARISFFGNVEYIYDNRFIIKGTFNREGSSRLAPSQRWLSFPGVSAGWRVNNESWFKSSDALDFVNDLKLRVTWGRQGNDPVSDINSGNYNYIAMLNTGNAYPFNNTRNPYFWQSTLASTMRTWERITTTDLGTDFSLFDNKLNGSFTYFWRETTGMLAPLQVPSVIGIGIPQYNAADMKAWGWEAELGFRNQLGDFNYFVSANIADNSNRITSYNGSKNIGTGLTNIVEGYPYQSLFLYQAEGFFQTQEEVDNHAFRDNQTGIGDIKYTDINGDGVISFGDATTDNPGDLVFAGDIRPRYQFGLNFGFHYKGFDFSALIQGVGKRHFLLPNIMTLPFIESWRQPWVIHADYWTPDNPDARFPRPFQGSSSNSIASTHWVINAAYARLKNLQIGYTLPDQFVQKIGLSRLRIYFTGEDLFEITKSWHPYIDPETVHDRPFGYPFFRTFSAGINLTI